MMRLRMMATTDPKSTPFTARIRRNWWLQLMNLGMSSCSTILVSRRGYDIFVCLITYMSHRRISNLTTDICDRRISLKAGGTLPTSPISGSTGAIQPLFPLVATTDQYLFGGVPNRRDFRNVSIMHWLCFSQFRWRLVSHTQYRIL